MATFKLYNGDGSTTDYTYPFELLGSFSQVVVKVRPRGEASFVTLDEGLESEGGDYSLNTVTSTVEFHTAPDDVTATDTANNIRIERVTSRSRSIDYTPGSTIREADLDNDANRLTSVDEEIEDGVTDALRLNDEGTAWDAEGKQVRSGAAATSGDHLTTLTQVEGLISNAEIAEIDNSAVIPYTGDGVETEFEIPNFKNLTEGEVQVMVNNVVQESSGVPFSVVSETSSNYPAAGTGWDFVVFAAAPPDSASIELKVIHGTITSRVGDGEIGSDQIGDDSVGLAAINIGAGDDKRFLVFDTSGDPAGRVAVHTDISDFDAGVRANRLDQMATPTADVAMGAKKITGHGPTADTDASTTVATKGYVDGKLLLDGIQKGSIANLDENESKTVTLGWAPEWVSVSGVWDDSAGDNENTETFSVVFGSTGDVRRVGDVVVVLPATAGAKVKPRARLTKLATGFKFQIEHFGDGTWNGVPTTTFRDIRYLALKA